jgi:3-oxosteroid 1-dehydrogenase
VLVPRNGDADVVVVGSGAAGLVAALTAASEGAAVTVLERSDWIGGTTAVSGGGIWAPGNHHMADAGRPDKRDEALEYCLHMVAGRMPEALVEAFVDEAAGMVGFVERSSPLRLRPVSWPDYRPELPGARTWGRMLESEPFDTTVLGEWAGRIRPAPVMVAPMTLEEQTVTWRLGYTPQKLDRRLLKERAAAGLTTVGTALVGALLAGCLAAGVEIRTGARARRLVTASPAAVGGVELEGGGALGATAVVLATGGFEWNEELKRAFLPGPLTHPTSPPVNEGDGLLMAMGVGAALANMTEAWWYPASQVPGDEYEGRPLSRFVATERTAPHCILVNRAGCRFVNEASNYNDVMKPRPLRVGQRAVLGGHGFAVPALVQHRRRPSGTPGPAVVDHCAHARRAGRSHRGGSRRAGADGRPFQRRRGGRRRPGLRSRR